MGTKRRQPRHIDRRSFGLIAGFTAGATFLPERKINGRVPMHVSPVKFGDRIAYRRQYKKLSVAQCSAAAGVSQETWLSWERNESLPNVLEGFVIATLLGTHRCESILPDLIQGEEGRARRLRAAREYIGLTVEEAAEECDVTPDEWNAAEGDLDEIPIGIYTNCDAVLEVNEWFLLCGSEEFAKKLRDAREKAGLSIADAAAAVGLEERDWQAFENNDHEPDQDEAERIAPMLGVSLKYLGYKEPGEVDTAELVA